jgi:hypothetical protein
MQEVREAFQLFCVSRRSVRALLARHSQAGFDSCQGTPPLGNKLLARSNNPGRFRNFQSLGTKQSAEKAGNFVSPSEARNLSSFNFEKKKERFLASLGKTKRSDIFSQASKAQIHPVD